MKPGVYMSCFLTLGIPALVMFICLIPKSAAWEKRTLEREREEMIRFIKRKGKL